MHMEGGHHAEPPQSGHKWFDITVAVCILLVSVSSLIVAIVHSATLERMADANARLVEANSWPYLGYDTDNALGPKQNTIDMKITNSGVGPAKIESVELKWSAKAQRNAEDFLRACCGYSADPSHSRLWTGSVTGRVLRAGETIAFITLFRTAGADPVWDRLDRARESSALSVNVCYCSVFDECWIEDVPRMSLSPQRVDRCQSPAVPYGLRTPK
jgi:hypothetical protein